MPESIVTQVRRLLDETPGERERAKVIYELVQAARDSTKFTHPGGECLDGRDGTERHEVGAILEKAIDHHDAAIHRWHQAQTSWGAQRD